MPAPADAEWRSWHFAVDLSLSSLRYNGVMCQSRVVQFLAIGLLMLVFYGESRGVTASGNGNSITASGNGNTVSANGNGNSITGDPSRSGISGDPSHSGVSLDPSHSGVSTDPSRSDDNAVTHEGSDKTRAGLKQIEDVGQRLTRQFPVIWQVLQFIVWPVLVALLAVWLGVRRKARDKAIRTD